MNYNNWEDNCEDDKSRRSCEKNVNKLYDVSVPVTVTPFAVPKGPEIKCPGDAKITPGHKHCDRRDKSFKFTITQRINVEMPVKFGAEVCFDEACSFDADKCT